MEPEALALTCARLLDEKKARDVLVLQVGVLMSITDYFVIATGLNVRHIGALSDQLQKSTEELEIRPLGTEGTPESGWVLVDLGDVIVHLFDPGARELYDLEVLWGDAPVLEWAT